MAGWLLLAAVAAAVAGLAEAFPDLQPSL